MAVAGAKMDAEPPGRPKGLLWKRIAAALREDIRGRSLTPGQQLPTEIALSERYQVSRFTTRRALAELEKEGLIRIEHGRGLFVAEDVIPYAIAERTRFTENMSRFNITGDREILGTERKIADSAMLQHLELPPGAEVIVVYSRASVGGRPLSVSENFYPAARFPDFDEIVRRNPSHTEALRAFGVLDYTRKNTRIISRLPTGREAHILKIPKTRPVLETQKVDVDLDGRPIAFGVAVYCGDRVQLIVEQH
ncbi:phosphonate metabolism transcriptional regulator PhnF [Terrarubrum flagellatum]|uniref:phosphonate metabolism transcriptional regulator PhnF n=1 Tax=Terrirubrum flagellatum TaxID=2895980 RepID=UPI00314502DC